MNDTMINLIPPQGKKLVAREYGARVAAVACASVALALVASTVALVPSYVLFSSSRNAQAPIEDVAGEEMREVEAGLRKAMALTQQLQDTTQSLEPLAIVNHVESAVSSAIVIESFALSHEKATHIQVRGSATTRESLRQFIEALKRDSFFADAQVPVSDLAPDTNLDFTVTLTLRTET